MFLFLIKRAYSSAVELLSYTQAVIGSNPVAPIPLNAGVVQLVRAPACHAGSCEFESRLPRPFFLKEEKNRGSLFPFSKLF